MIRPQGKQNWHRIEHIFETATTRTHYVGFIDLVKPNPTPCHAYILKKKKQGRIKKNIYG